jgi:hypothetical protein
MRIVLIADIEKYKSSSLCGDEARISNTENVMLCCLIKAILHFRGRQTDEYETAVVMRQNWFLWQLVSCCEL